MIFITCTNFPKAIASSTVSCVGVPNVSGKKKHNTPDITAHEPQIIAGPVNHTLAY